MRLELPLPRLELALQHLHCEVVGVEVLLDERVDDVREEPRVPHLLALLVLCERRGHGPTVHPRKRRQVLAHLLLIRIFGQFRPHGIERRPRRRERLVLAVVGGLLHLLDSVLEPLQLRELLCEAAAGRNLIARVPPNVPESHQVRAAPPHAKRKRGALRRARRAHGRRSQRRAKRRPSQRRREAKRPCPRRRTRQHPRHARVRRQGRCSASRGRRAREGQRHAQARPREPHLLGRNSCSRLSAHQLSERPPGDWLRENCCFSSCVTLVQLPLGVAALLTHGSAGGLAAGSTDWG
ncbi:hypothetical protein T484DRAFT_1989449 [Baffinella frigidus]|nr:hypothetical protein T484DRAFT_1989449 [Cryptophyta sp. CCMP2293]|mmetsp:Transcript_38529/g.91099  ORF Transcript_38529/g.91099 Transcript_38529/m.91099 type:complete len:295 (+) Transcript_38529:228-1112(+)